MSIVGKCLCGAVEIKVDGGHTAAVSACHCHMCQRWSGALFATFDASADGVTVIGPVARYRSSDISERAFCATCGSNLWIRDHADGADYELMAGLFPDASRFPLISEIYIDQAPAYLPLAGTHARKTTTEYEASNPSVQGDAT